MSPEREAGCQSGPPDAVKLLRRAARLAESYLDGLDERRVGGVVGYAETVAALDRALPEEPTDPVAVLEQLAAAVGPSTVASAGPRYFGLVTGGGLPAALAADWLVSAWDQNAFSQDSSPAGAAVEAVAERWVLEALGLPRSMTVGFVTGATAGNLVGVLAARHRLLARVGWDVEADGLTGAPPVRVLVGEEVHPSLLVAVRMAGLGERRVQRVGVDGQGAMRAPALTEALAARSGPVLVCAQAGNVNTGACDPLREIVAAAREHSAWVHVDGAFGLWAAAAPSRRHLVDGADTADSWATDAHKWLNVPYDCGLAIVADADAARAALGTSASYLPTATTGGEPFERVPEMSRRARAIPVYAALHSLGRSGLKALVERCCTHARRLAAVMHATHGAEVLNDVVLNQVLVRFDNDDATTRAVVAKVQHAGDAWVGATVWRNRAAIRISVSNWSTTEHDIDRLASALKRAHTSVRDDPQPSQPPDQ